MIGFAAPAALSLYALFSATPENRSVVCAIIAGAFLIALAIENLTRKIGEKP